MECGEKGCGAVPVITLRCVVPEQLIGDRVLMAETHACHEHLDAMFENMRKAMEEILTPGSRLGGTVRDELA